MRLNQFNNLSLMQPIVGGVMDRTSKHNSGAIAAPVALAPVVPAPVAPTTVAPAMVALLGGDMGTAGITTPDRSAPASLAPQGLVGDALAHYGAYGALAKLTSASWEEEIGKRDFKKYARLALADLVSSFAFDESKDELVCYLRNYQVEVRFSKDNSVAKLLVCQEELGDAFKFALTVPDEVSRCVTSLHSHINKDKKEQPLEKAVDFLRQKLQALRFAQLTDLKKIITSKKKADDVQEIEEQAEADTKAIIERLQKTELLDKFVQIALSKSKHQEYESLSIMLMRQLTLALYPERNAVEVEQEHYFKLARTLYLLYTQALNCEDSVCDLFYKKDSYVGFFTEVKAFVARVLARGLNDINTDLREQAMHLYIKAASFDIDFLQVQLKGIYSSLGVLLKQVDEQESLYVQKKASQAMSKQADQQSLICYKQLCKIINTIDAISACTDRRQLVNLYDLNHGREYVLPEITILGCARYRLTLSDGSESTRYYFYDFFAKKFVVIRHLQTMAFSTSPYLMDTDIFLDKAVNRLYQVKNAFIIDNKLKNSGKSLPRECKLAFGERLDLYRNLAEESFAQLTERAYAEARNYFDP